jgi:GntR family transcriptional regulator
MAEAALTAAGSGIDAGAEAGASRPLDRDAPLPLYFQLKQALLEDIRRRELRPGDRLPTETEIEGRYGVSRATIRQALAELSTEGVIRRIQGLGTFVATPKIQHAPSLLSFSELAAAQGFVPSHRVLSSTVVEAPAEVADQLDIDDGASCRHLRRLLLADGKVVGLAETWLPRQLLGPHDGLLEEERLGDGSLYRLLESPPVGIRPHHATETISASVATKGLAELLECEVGTPVLQLRRRSFTPEGRPMEFSRLRFVSERYEYRVEMQRPTEAGR